MQPASRAPGVSSVGMIRAIAASIVARWCASKNVSGMNSSLEQLSREQIALSRRSRFALLL
jgi:hypothetical protein